MFRRKGGPVRPQQVAPVEPTGEGIVPFTRVVTWLASAFGFQIDIAPSRMRLPTVQPVVDVYRGQVMVQAVADPAAGVAALIDIPAGELWEILAVFAELTTDATVANREMEIQAQVEPVPGVGLVTIYQARANFTQTASLNRPYSFAPVGIVGDVATISDVLLVPTPVGLKLPPLSRIRIQAAGIQAGDTIINVKALYSRWNV